MSDFVPATPFVVFAQSSTSRTWNLHEAAPELATAVRVADDLVDRTTSYVRAVVYEVRDGDTEPQLVLQYSTSARPDRR